MKLPRVTRQLADRELVELQQLNEAIPKSRPRPPLFRGDFRAELARHLYDQNMGQVSEPIDNRNADQQHQLVHVQVPSHLATDWAVTLGSVERIHDSYQTPAFDAYAIVNFGTAGGHARVEVDWRQGCTFVVSGDHVEVLVVMPNKSALPAAPEEWPITFRASIAPTTRPSATRITRSIEMATIAAGGAAFADVVVPPFAYRWQIRNGIITKTAVQFTVAYYDESAIPSATGALEYIWGNSAAGGYAWGHRWQMVPPSCQFMRLTNLHAAQALVTPYVIYELAL